MVMFWHVSDYTFDSFRGATRFSSTPPPGARLGSLVGRTPRSAGEPPAGLRPCPTIPPPWSACSLARLSGPPAPAPAQLPMLTCPAHCFPQPTPAQVRPESPRRCSEPPERPAASTAPTHLNRPQRDRKSTR